MKRGGAALLRCRIMFTLGKAKDALEHWILGAGKESQHSSAWGLPKTLSRAPRLSIVDQKVRLFIDGLKAAPPDWLGRVRLINFDAIRNSLGDRWPRLQDKIELLAEKIISDELSARDLYLNMGEAEFAIYFADATPEETKIRCLAIVEAIHAKLFGVEDKVTDGSQRVAECHLVHTADLIMDWESADVPRGAPHDGQAPLETLRGLFRHDAEVLDPSDTAASIQTAIDSIISGAIGSRNRSELNPLLDRVKRLSRSLNLLEPALLASTETHKSIERNPGRKAGQPQDGCRPGGSDWDRSISLALSKARGDAVELTAILDADANHSHKSLLEELTKLRCARAGRLERAIDDDIPPSAVRATINKGGMGKFEYVPVFRSVSLGGHIYQGIYRVGRQSSGQVAAPSPRSDLRGYRLGDGAAVEQLLLKHAIEVLAGQEIGGRFMLMVPVHVETLHGPLPLTRYSTLLRAAELRAKRRLIIEIVGYRDSDNTISIRRAIGELRIQCHAIFVTLSQVDIGELENVAVECKRLNVNSVGIDVACAKETDAKVMSALTEVFAVGDRFALPTHIDGVESVPVLAKAIAGGINYICAPALRPALPIPQDVKQVTLEDLYSVI